MTPYIHFEINTRSWPESVMRLYPLVCLHIGAKQCDLKFINQQISRIKNDPCAKWVYMGDGGECVTKYSKGDLYAQVISPGAQLEMLIDLLDPIKDKGLFGIRGNHGHRIYKESGLHFDQQLLTRLGLPYMGVAAGANFLINRSSYDCFFHHGIDSGVALVSKITKAESFNKFINADAIFTAHSHIAQDLQPAALLEFDNGARKLRTKLRHQYICGSAYDSRSGYAEEKGYPPLLPSWLTIEFSGHINEGRPVYRQQSTVHRSTADYDLTLEPYLKYIEEDR